MIVAIPASTNNIGALADERFGRCPFFCFYNTQTSQPTFKVNDLKDESGGVGLKVAEFLADNKVDELFAVEVGPKAADILKKLNIKIHPVEPGKTMKELIDKLNH